MKDPEEEIKLPPSERQAPVLSSSVGEEEWSDDDVLANTAASTSGAGEDVEVGEDNQADAEQAANEADKES
ncbi:unnamed protein product [Cuscuta europaea]|uniref:Uncharacterized protein n=1 Tax=Cuscuta europaea TaxID=41803 RepID=A0A9P0Z201_CUSEU|nr:unnamed protein product [Cuscuta europaea]